MAIPQTTNATHFFGLPLALCAGASFSRTWWGKGPGHAGLGALTLLRSRSRSSRMAFMVALVLFSSSSLLHSMAVRLSFSSLSPASSFSQRDRSSARLGYRSRPSTPSISSTVWKTQPQRQAKGVTGRKGKDRSRRDRTESPQRRGLCSHFTADRNHHEQCPQIIFPPFSDEALPLAWGRVCVNEESPQ